MDLFSFNVLVFLWFFIAGKIKEFFNIKIKPPESVNGKSGGVLFGFFKG